MAKIKEDKKSKKDKKTKKEKRKIEASKIITGVIALLLCLMMLLSVCGTLLFYIIK